MESYPDLLVNILRNNKKNFNRVLGIGMIFIIYGLFYIVLPFHINTAEYAKSTEILRASEDSLIICQKELTEYKSISKKLKTGKDRIDRNVDGFPRQLANYIRGINTGANSAVSSQMLQSSGAGQSGQIDDGELDYSARIDQYLDNWFKKLIDDIQQNMIDPSIQLEITGDTQEDESIAALAADANTQIRNHINEIDPDFWFTIEEKRDVAQDIIDQINELFTPVFNRIDELVEISGEKVDDANSRIEEYSSNTRLYQDKINEVEKRIKELESPIGKIPLDLNNFSRLYPLVIIIMILMLCSFFIRCRRSVGELRSELNKPEANKDKKYIDSLTACWFLPPFKSPYNRLIILSSILMTTIAYITSIILVIIQMELAEPIDEILPFLVKIVFILIYAGGLAMIIWGYQSIGTKFKDT